MAALERMYRPREQLFAFRVRDTAEGLRVEGTSRRYTAIALIGLASEPEPTISRVLAGGTLRGACGPLLDGLAELDDLGDVALTWWAAHLAAHPRSKEARHRLWQLFWSRSTHPTVELSWTLASLCAGSDGGPTEYLRESVARMLLSAFNEHSALFSHAAGWRRPWLKRHVACFADLVYPIHALAQYHRTTGSRTALEAALRCAERLCGAIGPDGQWWWHYDVRTGRVVEKYPVYSVHQDAMAPMALFALAEAGGPFYRRAINRALSWLAGPPELAGGSLIDEDRGVIWRKVARREPRKFVRRVQAVATRVHPAFCLPGMDTLFPPGVMAAECRPYHLGWLLHAWPGARVARWDGDGEATDE